MSYVSADSVLVPAPGVEGRRFGEELLLLDGQSARLSGLNDTAAYLWEQLDGSRSIRELVNVLRSEQPGASATLLNDAVCFFEALAHASLVIHASGPKAPVAIAPQLSPRSRQAGCPAPQVAWSRELVALAQVTPPPCFPPDSEHCVG